MHSSDSRCVFSRHKAMRTISRCYRQVESHIRMEKALQNVLTTTNTLLTDADIGTLLSCMSDDAQRSHSVSKKNSNRSIRSLLLDSAR
jgi:hypothetical protein